MAGRAAAKSAPAVPEFVPPMLAVAGAPPTGEGWVGEFKWDGYRAVASISPGQLRITSRNGNPLLAQFPELDVLADLADRRLVLDGEIVAVGRDGRPDFGRLQHRRGAPSRWALAHAPVHYYVFDLLYLDSAPLLTTPYRVRRQLLAELELPAVHARLQMPPSFPDTAPEVLLRVAAEYRLEGIVTKRAESTYTPGARSRAWIKSPLTRSREVVIGGWTPGSGGRAATFGSLLLGAHDDAGDLVYIGRVGSGLSEFALRDLRGRLDPLTRSTSPFATPVPRDHARVARWVQPRLVGEVEFRSWTSDNQLRHATWRGLRPDRGPDEVKLPSDQ